MRVIVCGGRDFNDWPRFNRRMITMHTIHQFTEIIEGGARGADTMAKTWAETFSVPVTEVPADWERHGKSAGYKRNEAMADLKPDVVIAFPGGVGTDMMKRIARARGIKVIEA